MKKQREHFVVLRKSVYCSVLQKLLTNYNYFLLFGNPLLLCPINWEFFLMHFALLLLKFHCHSQITRLSDYRGKTQYIAMQEFRSLTICVRWELTVHAF